MQDVLYTCGDTQVKAWMAGTLDPIWSVQCEDVAQAMQLCEDKLVVSVYKAPVSLFSIADGSRLQTLSGVHNGSVLALAVRPPYLWRGLKFSD
jgi:hypothetical protein